MNKFEVTSPTGITLPSGILGLQPEQAQSRSFALGSLGDGLYQILKPVQFKAGEVIAYDGPLTKAMATQLKSKKGKG